MADRTPADGTAADAAAPPQPLARTETSMASRARQLVDGKGELVADSLARFVDESGLGPADGFGIVSIMGPQSSGKSTLMNLLFGTPFTVMDGQAGRSQTTLGVWVSRAEHSLLVLDLQGTDSIEGGDDAKKFERQSSLFALALSDVLLVNVWFQDLGRHDASNMSLLRTVFEVHVGLFGKERRETKTVLLFLIRDHIASQTPLDRLEGQVHRDIDAIWAAIDKPASLAGAPLSELFDVRIAALPHFVFQQPEFQAAVGDLKRRFAPGEADGALLPRLCPPVPADGLSDYVSNLWAAIQAEADLDLPTQKQVLSMHRCQQIAAAALEAYRDGLGPLRASLHETARATVPALATALAALYAPALEAYDSQSGRYERTKQAERRAELRVELEREIAPLVRTQLRNGAADALAAFEVELVGSLPEGGEVAPDYTNLATAMAEAAAAAFGALVEAACGSPLRSLLCDESALATLAAEASDSLLAAVGSLSDAARAKQQLQLVELINASAASALLSQLAKLLDRAPDDLWQRIAEARGSLLDDATLTGAFAAQLASLGVAPSELRPSVARHLDEILLTKLRAEASGLRFRLLRVFERAFRYGADGLPHVWGPKMDIGRTCLDAKQAASGLLALFTSADARRLLGYVGPELVAADEAAHLEQGLEQEVAAAFQTAKVAQDAQLVQAKVPTWLLVLIPVLGWNELVYLLTSPLLCLLLSTIAAAAFGLNVLSPGLPAALAKRAVGLLTA